MTGTPGAEVAATLIVSSSYSTCGECRQQTLPDAPTHGTVSGYGGGKPGCGATFTAITSDTARLDDPWRAALNRMRPDLPIIKYHETPPALAAHKIGPIRRIHRAKHLDFCALGDQCSRRHDFLATCSCGWRDSRGRRMYAEREAAAHLAPEPAGGDRV